jgi:hypothetical protein
MKPTIEDLTPNIPQKPHFKKYNKYRFIAVTANALAERMAIKAISRTALFSCLICGSLSV